MYRLLLLVIGLLTACSAPKSQSETDIRIKKKENGYQLLVNDEPFFVQGAGGDVNMYQMKNHGVNSFRTWGPDNAAAQLDSASKHGLYVALGLWVGHERHGFDYDDEQRVAEQLEKFRAIVKEHAGHPNILVWGIGNEVNHSYKNTKVWNAVQDIAAMIKELDPGRPTMTVTAGLDSMLVQEIKEKCPDIDILGINSYGGLGSIPERIDRFGWTKPYMITEWGPSGHWEVPKTEWKVSVEETADKKAELHIKRYHQAISRDPQCLGGYVFKWGQKQERTPTWYGVYLENGMSLPTLDAVQYLYTGEWPENRAPKLNSLTLNGKTAYDNVRLKSGKKATVKVKVEDREGDELAIAWEIIPEAGKYSSGGDRERRPESVNIEVNKMADGEYSFNAPKEKGAYRIFVYANDPHGKATTANIPFFVE